MTIQNLYFHAQTDDGDKCLPDTCGTEIDGTNEQTVFDEAARTATEVIEAGNGEECWDGWEIRCMNTDGNELARYYFDEIEERLIAETISPSTLRSIDSQNRHRYRRTFMINADELAAHCYCGAIKNVKINGGTFDFSDGTGGAAATVDVYLNGTLKNLPEWVQRKVVASIQDNIDRDSPDEPEAA